ncbi:hypothetical protein SAY87_031649 [Trapa incisa]|uniref:Uncharacterized protein n=1 Tax=Trapa incisa TaxID=236973 RepID=A0AAN7KQ45_9MYRT|nr:hypothetical protein SAY87_031649 [Trapa incisa]
MALKGCIIKEIEGRSVTGIHCSGSGGAHRWPFGSIQRAAPVHPATPDTARYSCRRHRQYLIGQPVRFRSCSQGQGPKGDREGLQGLRSVPRHRALHAVGTAGAGEGHRQGLL